jgi:F-type H+-transporting ATPase subunit delta
MAVFASRYANALADLLFEHKLNAGNVLASLREVAEVFEGSGPLRKVLTAPSVPLSQKHKLLDALLAKMGVAEPLERNFLAVLVDHARIGSLTEVVGRLEVELEHRLGRVPAGITSSRTLSAAEQAVLLENLTKLTGKTVTPSYRVDESLLGGAVVRIGSVVYDGSVRGRLQRIKQDLGGE